MAVPAASTAPITRSADWSSRDAGLVTAAREPACSFPAKARSSPETTSAQGSVGVSCDAGHTLEGAVKVGNRFTTTVGVDLGANYTGVANRGIVIAGNSMGGAQQPVTGGDAAVVWAALRNATTGEIWDGFATSEFRAPVFARGGITTRLTSRQPTDSPEDGTIYIDADTTDPKIWVRTGGT